MKGFNDSPDEEKNFLNTTLAGTGALYISGTVLAEREIVQGSLNLEGNEEINQFFNLKNGHVQADINVAESARIYNDGTLTLTGGDTGINTNTITGDNGTLEIESNITNRGSITQNKVDTKGHTLTNDGTFNATGATFNHTVNGQGEMVIAGNTENTNTADNAITQSKLTVNNTGVFTTAANTVKADIVNNGILNLTGGTNNNAIINNATLAFQGGSEEAAMLNNKAIAGNGTLNIEGVVENAKGQSIANNVMIASGKSLTAYADDILGNVTNNGTMNFTGGTIQQSTLGGQTKVLIPTGLGKPWEIPTTIP